MNVLELFAGSRSIGKAFERRGHDVFSSDIKPFDDIDYVIDILDFDMKKLSHRIDAVWASPDCTTYSIAACSTHREYINGVPMPKTEKARIADAVTQQTIAIINHLLFRNEDMIFFIENPRGLLRKMPFMQSMKCYTVTYCQYGDDRMKPTDIWSNVLDWSPRKMCKNGDKCHTAAPRGSATGTQGRKGSYERSKIPEKLCDEIVKLCEEVLEEKQFIRKRELA